MKITRTIRIETDDQKVYEVREDLPLTLVSSPVSKPYVMLNVVNWESIIVPYFDISEATYFVLTVASTGTLLGGNGPLETKFVQDTHAKGKKATFSIAGGSQDAYLLITALTVNRPTFIANIVQRVRQYGYDGVTLDFEHTAVQDMDENIIPDFINALRVALGPTPIIGMYTQPEQLTTSHRKLEVAKAALTWASVMVYDAGPYNASTFRTISRPWADKVGKDKYLGGVAVNYATTNGGLSVAQYGEVLDIVTQEGWKGVGVWQHSIFTEPWRAMQRSKWSTLA